MIIPKILWKLDFRGLNVLYCLGRILGIKGAMTGEQLIDCDSCRPLIDHIVINSSSEKLGSLVKARSSASQHLLNNPASHSFLALSKISDLYFLVLLIVQNILRLNIPMASPFRVHISNGIE